MEYPYSMCQYRILNKQNEHKIISGHLITIHKSFLVPIIIDYNKLYLIVQIENFIKYVYNMDMDITKSYLKQFIFTILHHICEVYRKGNYFKMNIVVRSPK